MNAIPIHSDKDRRVHVGKLHHKKACSLSRASWPHETREMLATTFCFFRPLSRSGLRAFLFSQLRISRPLPFMGRPRNNPDINPTAAAKISNRITGTSATSHRKFARTGAVFCTISSTNTILSIQRKTTLLFFTMSSPICHLFFRRYTIAFSCLLFYVVSTHVLPLGQFHSEHQ